MGTLHVCHTGTLGSFPAVSDTRSGSPCSAHPHACLPLYPCHFAPDAFIPAYCEASCPTPSLAMSPAVVNFIPVLGHVGRPPLGGIRPAPLACASKHFSGCLVTSLPVGCCISGRLCCTISKDSPGPGVPSFLSSHPFLPCLMGLWVIRGVMMEEAHGVWMSHARKQGCSTLGEGGATSGRWQQTPESGRDPCRSRMPFCQRTRLGQGEGVDRG